MRRMIDQVVGLIVTDQIVAIMADVCHSELSMRDFHKSVRFLANMGGGSRDNHGNDYGFGYPRGRDDRGGGHSGGNRDYNRQGQRNRYHDDDNRSNSGVDRPRYGGRYSDTR